MWDLRIAEADSVSAFETYAKADSQCQQDASVSLRVALQTEALLEDRYQQKVRHYAREGVVGVTPWIMTSMGMVHSGLLSWFGLLPGETRQATLAACCKRLVRGRALRASHRQ